jgi:hypothetical protein
MKRPPVHGRARLILMINDVPYTLRILCQGWRLTKGDGVSYEVHCDEFGAHCTCADYLYCREKAGEKCKHCRALTVVGILPKE